MSAWTKRFMSVADAFPEATIDQIIGYANRYTKWQSEASLRVQCGAEGGWSHDPPNSDPPRGLR